MRISFICTVYNEEKNIGRLLDGILNQKKSPDEIIIVDGGSTDNTYELLKKYSDKEKKIKIFLKKGYNIAKARNFAIGISKGEVIFSSDAGCTIDSDWISDTINYFPEKDVVAGSYGAIVKNKFEYFQSLINVRKVNKPSRISSRNLAFKKNCWKEVGGYPEADLAGEDTLFNINLLKKGFKIAINPIKHIKWEMRPTFWKFTKQFIRYGQGDRIQGNLLRMKKNLAMIIFFWAYLIFLILSPLISLKVTMILISIPLIYFIIVGSTFFFKTLKVEALIYIPIFILLKRIGYIYGATLYRGTIRYSKKK